MASKVFNIAKQKFANGGIDWDTDDIRVSLHMTNTTIDTENDGITTNTNFTTSDEFDGTGYTAGGNTLDSEAVNLDDPNDRAELDAADEVFSTLGAGTRSIAGALIYKFVTSWAASTPIAWVEFSATPSGGDLTIQWNAEGIIQLA